jgi:hypothetical protein
MDLARNKRLAGMILLGVLDRQGSFGIRSLFAASQFRCRIRRGLLAKVLLHPEVDRHNHSDYGKGAEHQYRKQNLHHHRISGYQNRGSGNPLLLVRFGEAVTGMKPSAGGGSLTSVFWAANASSRFTQPRALVCAPCLVPAPGCLLKRLRNKPCRIVPAACRHAKWRLRLPYLSANSGPALLSNSW